MLEFERSSRHDQHIAKPLRRGISAFVMINARDVKRLIGVHGRFAAVKISLLQIRLVKKIIRDDELRVIGIIGLLKARGHELDFILMTSYLCKETS